jgi:hypothetical protein
VGGTLNVILRLTVPAGTNPGDQEITSLVGTSHFGPVTGRATAISTAVSNVDTPQISFTKTDSPDPVLGGNVITYTLTYGTREAEMPPVSSFSTAFRPTPAMSPGAPRAKRE